MTKGRVTVQDIEEVREGAIKLIPLADGSWARLRHRNGVYILTKVKKGVTLLTRELPGEGEASVTPSTQL